MANTTWNPSDKTAGIALSGSNLTAAWGGSLGQGVRAADRQVSGKYYWEITLAGGLSNIGVGVGNGAVPLNSLTPSGAANSVGLAFATNSGTLGSVLVDGVLYSGLLGSLGAANPICIALDLDNRLIWFRVGATGNWNGSATGNPATGAAGIASPFGFTLAAYPLAFWNAGSAGSTQTANFGDSAFTGTAPSGFTAGFLTGSPTNIISVPGVVRETLFTTTAAANAAGVVREVLLATPTAATLAGVVREVLLLSPPPATAMQTAIVINTG